MDNQALFALFFAIFWGGIMNVSGRWRMFQPLFCFGRTFCRFSLSFLLMVLLPIWYFSWQLWIVGDGKPFSTGAVFAAVLPSLGVFSFYRVWMFIVEGKPRWFYWSTEERVPDHRIRLIDPSIETLNIGKGFTTLWNLLAAVIYFVFAVVVPMLIR